MSKAILGLHHITAIAKDPQRNYDFYTKTMGLRFVKKTVNFDDPGTYHFYFGNETGTPGTVLTFFPWPHIVAGKRGVGMATEIGYSVPQGSLDFWKDRFNRLQVKHEAIAESFGEKFIAFEDPDGLRLKLVVPQQNDNRPPWITNDVTKDVATKGFHSVVLTLKSIDETAKILTDVFGYTLLKQEGNVYRFITTAVEGAAIVDLVETPDGEQGRTAAGINHHVAFRVKDDNILMEYHEKIAQRGLHITPKIDRNYFFSLYFREPGGVLFELATDNPGFANDEPVNELGTHLKLPPQYEPQRKKLEQTLPPLQQ